MATKKLIIEAEVKTDQLDKAVQKLGQLKDLGKGLKIQYDIDGKPLDVIIDKSKNLQQQFKLVTAELKRTKEGTAEFALLAKKQSDIQDGLARTKAKSGDLLTSLQLLPGPIGEFASKMNGAIALLKTFSSFSLKDLSFQFKETVNDIKDIINGFLGINKATETNSNSIINNTGDVVDNTDAKQENADIIDEGTSSTNAGTVATIKNNAAIKEQGASLFKNVNSWRDLNKEQQTAFDSINKLEEKYKGYLFVVDKEDVALRKLDGNYRSLTNAEIDLLASGKDLIITQDGLIKKMYGATIAGRALGGAMQFVGVSFTTAAVAVGIFETALAAIGIGIIISGIVALGNALIDGVKSLRFWKSNAEIAAEENERLATSYKLLSKAINETQDAIQAQTDIAILQAKIAGKTEEELYNITLDGYNKRVQANIDGRKKIEGQIQLLSINTKLTEEERLKKTKELEDEYVKLGDKSNDLSIEGKKLVLIEQLRIADKARQGLKKSGELIVDDNKAASALLLKLQQENRVNILNEERKKQDKQLEIDKENEEREINNLKLTKDKEELRGKLLEQIRDKYSIKVSELTKKRLEEDDKIREEDLKKLIEYKGKIFEIMNNADENELSRNKASRTKKFQDDFIALQDDTNFKKQTLEEQNKILFALEKRYKEDLQKLDDDDAQDKRDKNLKKLDDELKFLQIRADALREGTKSFFDNQRAILKAAEKKELADLEDRGIKEKLTIEQIEAEKLNIKKKYLKASKDIATQELQAILQAAQATLGVAQTIAQDIGKVAQIEQQVALEQATKRYIKQNELDKKTITNQEQLDAKLIENKKKFAQEEDDIKRKAFEENKKIQIAQAIIATLQSAVGAFSSLIAIPIVGPVLAPIAAAAALVFGYKQVAAIKKTQYQSSLELSSSETSGVGSVSSKCNPGKNYADGGLIGGKRHAQGGTMIEAEQGEAIMTRGAVTQFAPLLSLMNQAGGGTSFNSNLMTTRQDNPILSNPAQEQAPLIVKTYVVSQELTTEAHKQARLKNLSTI